MSEERANTRWFYDLLHPNRDQRWQFKENGEWFDDLSRPKLPVTEERLIEDWWKVLVNATHRDHRSVSTIAKDYNTTIRHIKTMRAYINTKNAEDPNRVTDVLLPELPDFTPYEQSRIDRAQAERTPSQLFDALPPTLRAKALKHLGLA